MGRWLVRERQGSFSNSRDYVAYEVLLAAYGVTSTLEQVVCVLSRARAAANKESVHALAACQRSLGQGAPNNSTLYIYI